MRSGFRTASIAVAFISSAASASPHAPQFKMEGKVTYVSELPGAGCGILHFWGKVTLSDPKGERRDAYISCMGEFEEAAPRLGQYCVAKYHIGEVHGIIPGQMSPAGEVRIVDTISCRG